MAEQKWEFPVKNWKDITLETAKYFFYQAEKRLDSTSQAFDVIDSKLHRILSWNIPILSAILVYILKLYTEATPDKEINYALIVPLGLMALCHFSSVIISLIGISPKNYSGVGTDPSNLIKQDFIAKPDEKKAEQDREAQTVQVILAECINYYERIQKNIKTNDEKADLLKKAIYAFGASPFLALIGAICFL